MSIVQEITSYKKAEVSSYSFFTQKGLSDFILCLLEQQLEVRTYCFSHLKYKKRVKLEELLLELLGVKVLILL